MNLQRPNNLLGRLRRDLCYSHFCQSRYLELLHYSDMSVFREASWADFNRPSASNIPFHASLSTLSSCRPRFTREFPSISGGSPTPREGGIKLGGGALIADGAMRE